MAGRKLTINDLEQMTTHELGELLANMAMILHRLPNVPVEYLRPIERELGDANQIAAKVRQETPRRANENLPDWLAEREED